MKDARKRGRGMAVVRLRTYQCSVQPARSNSRSRLRAASSARARVSKSKVASVRRFRVNVSRHPSSSRRSVASIH
jgi:hypothetical protein